MSTSTTADPEWQAAISKRGHAYTSAYCPDIWPLRPYASTSKNDGHPLRAATPAVTGETGP
jgi:hypothetical protein